MKIKNCFTGAAIIGFLAGVLRVLQYIFTIDDRGFYTDGRLSTLAAGVLVGLLAGGVLWSIVCGGSQPKGQALFFQKYCSSTPTRVLFAVLGLISIADGILRITAEGLSLIPMLCIVGGLAWLSISAFGAFLPLMELMPLLQLCGLIVDYFRHTYKYIQVSEYALSLLGLCAITYFALVLLKVLSGAECTRRRLVGASCILLVCGCSSFLAPLAGGFSLNALIFAVHGFAYCLLAALTLIWLPEGKPPVTVPNEAPKPEALDQYINEIPEVQEDEL
ncbi:MAG: hypothetical protein IKM48_02995 [Clostridia bacterium]|nr:hypothetical protein [Clostridia bacterium]